MNSRWIAAGWLLFDLKNRGSWSEEKERKKVFLLGSKREELFLLLGVKKDEEESLPHGLKKGRRVFLLMC